MAVVVLWLVLPSIATQLVNRDYPDRHSQDMYRLVLALTYAGRIAALGFVVWQSGDSFQSFGVRKDKIARICGLTALILAADVGTLLISTPKHSLPRVSMEAFGRYSPFSWWVLVLFTIIAATAEEVLYRCYLITRLKELLGSAEWAIAISFITFGSIHIFRGLEGFVSASVFGLILSVAFVRTRSLVPLAAAHSLHNLWLAVAIMSS